MALIFMLSANSSSPTEPEKKEYDTLGGHKKLILLN
jgi:hypothetical protein